MKKSIFILSATLIFSCSDYAPDQEMTLDSNYEGTVIFGSRKNIENAKSDNTLLDAINFDINTLTPLEAPPSCYDGTGWSDNGGTSNPDIEDGGFEDAPNTYGRYFITDSGDGYISGDNDSDAIQRQIVIGGADCGIPPTPSLYINVVIENSVNANWINAINSALNSWNLAINNNPLNPLGLDSPRIYFRIVNQTNPNDYGNITIRMFPFTLGAINETAVASATVGGINRIPGTQLFKHRVGNSIRINSRYYAQYEVQLAITAMVHEIGHTLGFKHSNTNAPNINGTSQNNESVMNSFVQHRWDSKGFHPQDFIAIDKIFNVKKDFILINCDNGGGLEF